MSKSNVMHHIMERIEIASPKSKIAVFKHEGIRGKKGRGWIHEPCLDLVFDSTVGTRNRIKQDSGRYIGSFDNTMNLHEVKNKLMDELHALEMAA